MFHLSQGGRIDFEPTPKATKPRGSVARFVFDGPGAFLLKEFGTERKAKWWVLAPGDTAPLDGLGPEPFDDRFAELVMSGEDKRRLHTMLRDQGTVAGIGRGFSDDILHRARLSPFDSLSSLSDEARKRLLDATHERLEEGLVAERQRTGGLPAKLKGRFEVHGRFGAPCPRCERELRRVSYDSYEITYCSDCQTGGKILADRRMSRLLK
jgi:formamidopyrimidine-DNA glycosylase